MIHKQGWVRLHLSFSDSANYGTATPATRPPSYLCTNVILAACYAADTWKGMTIIAHMLDVFYRRCLRTILGISWRDDITNDELMRRAGMEDL